MDAQKVDMFIMSNQKNLPADKIVYLREKMLAADEGKFALLTTVDIKDSTTLLLISIFLGGLGIDRLHARRYRYGHSQAVDLRCVRHFDYHRLVYRSEQNA